MLAPMLVKYAILLGVFFYYFNNGDVTFHLFVFAALFVFDILPALILHLQYYMANRKTTLIINSKVNTISIIDKEINVTKDFSDITELALFSSYGGGLNTGLYSFGDYKYCKIKFKDISKGIIISCLMVNSIQSTLENVLHLKMNKKLGFFAFLKDENHKINSIANSSLPKANNLKP